MSDPVVKNIVEKLYGVERTLDECPFCKIVDGRSPAEIVRSGWDYLAIRPLGPVNDTHVLFIPHTHVADFAGDPELTARLMADIAWFAREREGYEQANVITSRGAAATQTINHFHVHLIGRTPDDGLKLPWGKLSSEHKMKEQPDDIR